MFRSETFKWFVVGLVATSLVLVSALAVTWPPSISAQDTVTDNRAASFAPAGAAVPQAPRTDNPSGELNVPFAAGPEVPNEAVLQQAAATGPQAPHTDNPSGELNVPLVAGPEIPNNQARPDVAATGATGAAVERAAVPEAVDAGYGSPLVIPGADFSNDGNTATGFFFSFAGGYLYASGTEYPCMKAPAYLPKGAHITDVWLSAVDNATADLSVDLHRVDNYNGAHVTMATMTTTGASASMQTPYDSTIASPDVAYPDYSYYVTTCMPNTTAVKLYSVRIYYTLP